jgi:hypothetical protein
MAFSLTASGDIIIDPKIEFTKIPSFSATPIEGENTHCREIVEIPNGYQCFAKSSEEMKKTFARISYHHDSPGYKIVAHDASELADTFYRSVSAYAFSGDAIKDFYKDEELACQSSGHDSSICLNKEEADLKVMVENIKAPDFAMTMMPASPIFISIRGTHELFHMQYFLTPGYKSTVVDFWAKVPEKDKSDIRKVLGYAGYDPANEDLMINEFQAFLLQYPGKSGHMVPYVPPYRDALLSALKNNGVPVPSLNPYVHAQPL